MPFVARFGFLLSVLVFLAPMIVCFCCASLLFAAFRFSLLLFLVFHCSKCQPPCIGPELKQTNENGNEKCSLLLFVARFGFWGVFPFGVRCFLLLFVARSCF